MDGRIPPKLKSTPEQQLVVGPLVDYLLSLGWSFDQVVFGKKEWQVPRRPSEASKREKGRSFEGFPVDVALFQSVKKCGDYEGVRIIVECKAPDERTGVSQLETYMSLEPKVQLGVWTNSADPTALAVFLFKTAAGSHAKRRRPLTDFPRPGDPIAPEVKSLTFADLTTPSDDVLRKVVEDLLDHVVVSDSVVTRREEQLDQICDLLLLKLDSDKQAKAAPGSPPYFRPRLSASETAREVRRAFNDLVNLYPEVFREAKDKQLRLADDTILECVERISPYRLIDVGVSTIAVAFQSLRSAALKQGEGQYFTPQQVIEAGIQLLQIEWRDVVIDPACGTGGFLVEVLMDMHRRHPGQESEVARWAQTHLFGIDKDGIGVKLTKALMQIAGDGSAHCVRGDSIRTHEWPRKYRELTGGSFDNGRFTVVVTNPPFGLNLKVRKKDSQQAGLDLAKRGRSDYSDLGIGLLFFQRAYELLRSGGRLGIVLPETYFFSPQYKFVLDWMKDRFRPTIVLEVPMEAFQGFCRAKTNFYVFEKTG